jgi:hypothetical protein
VECVVIQVPLGLLFSFVVPDNHYFTNDLFLKGPLPDGGNGSQCE